MNQDELFTRIKHRCLLVGNYNDDLSEVWALLAHILAFYKVRGTEPEAMLEGVRSTVEKLAEAR